MANYSRFYGEVLFYNKKIKNIEDKDDKKLVLNYDNIDWYTIFQNIEKSIKKYIGGRGLKICQITS